MDYPNEGPSIQKAVNWITLTNPHIPDSPSDSPFSYAFLFGNFASARTVDGIRKDLWQFDWRQVRSREERQNL
jgi:hypothetical protein